MLESAFQTALIKKLKDRYPGCIILKNDPKYKQGIPDLLFLYKNKWAALECKQSKSAKHRPNQDYWVDKMNKMSFAKFIYPENEEDIINEMEQTLSLRGHTRHSKRK
jgi:hypothetical protein